ncbi:uncharacterized protein LOC135831292 isoform X2 [Planococcus citri]|uniref:uncharacterized protein LOC135831292 isoform X2 n=1 Tax=Planococcus citri TaxID=170843 RepID=UPI0031F86139
MITKLISFCFLISLCDSILRCSKINKPVKSDYFLMQTCTGSDKNIIAQTYAQNLDSCKNFSARYKGLGFNYADPDDFEIRKKNCIVYDCPEFNITAVKQYESMFNYYSLYARVFPTENMTCVPKEGIFMISYSKLNYTDAAAKCEEYGGILANIITEELSMRVANIIAKSQANKNRQMQAYVGEPLNCLSFRSWAPGEPRSRYLNEDCVTIDANRYWRAQQCNKTFPFICEILPFGPLDLADAYCSSIDHQSIKKECFDYYTSAEIDFENEVCNRTDEDNTVIRERMLKTY